MRPVLTHDENIEKPLCDDTLNNDSDSDNDSDYVPDHQEESDHVVDEESVTSDDDRDDECRIQSPKTPSKTPVLSLTAKRKALDNETNDDSLAKKSRSGEEAERRVRVDTIWAEMNKKDNSSDKKLADNVSEKEKHPLDDISSSLNQTSATPCAVADPKKKSCPNKEVAPLIPKKKGGIVRPKSTLTALVSQYNIKVPKMNTLEKSRADWQGFVKREGIQDDLKYKNKDGYMEKVAFLNRVDDRRLTQLKSGRKASKR